MLLTLHSQLITYKCVYILGLFCPILWKTPLRYKVLELSAQTHFLGILEIFRQDINMKYK